ncbi:MAG: sulfotransferase [Verrucomicrobia bacterium]|nr:sulfotransferase [Verrucomicrobiota bacterium]
MNTGQPTTTDWKAWWTQPRLWAGGNASAFGRVLARNHCAVHWSLVPSAGIAFSFALANSLLGQVENLLYGRRIRATDIPVAPVFVLGHWRTGTTLLHEMLALDERHAAPTSYDCFSPCHFLLTGRWLPRWLQFMLPARRPMDNMAVTWDKPQEDEFALALLGVPSPYNTTAFPNRPPMDMEYLDFEGVPPEAVRRWQEGFLRLLRRLTVKDPRRLVLKSPAHMARLKVLLEMFPEAKFVHIVRDPYRVFISTMKLWRTLYRRQGLQRPSFEGLDERVFETFLRLHRRFEEDRPLIPSGHYHELRYEDLVRDPVGAMRTLYDRLALGDFDRFRPRLEGYWAALAGYEANTYEMPPGLRDEITRRWGGVIRRQGYGGTAI